MSMSRSHPWELRVALWECVRPLILARPPHPKGGRPARSDRNMLGAILCALRNCLPLAIVVADANTHHLKLTASML